MKKLRKIIFWCHLPVGVAAGVVILIMCVTGVLLSYEKQITSWADTRGYRAAPPGSEIHHLPVETLITKAREARGATPTAVTLKSDPLAPAEIAFGRETTLFVNPYTGAILGEGSQKTRNFFRVVTDWHRWLGAKGANRPAPASSAPQTDNLNVAWTRAEQQVDDWQTISMQLPTASSAPLTFNFDRGNGGQPQKRAQLVLDRATNNVVRWEPFSTYTRGRQLRSILRFAHTGEVIGMAGQTIAALVSAGGAVLVVTGLALAIRRLLGWRARRAKSTQPTIAEPLPNTAGD